VGITKFDGELRLNRQLSLDEHNFLVDLHNSQPSDKLMEGQPTSFCQWEPSRDGWVIKWDEGEEEFCLYVEWLEFLITAYFAPRGYILNGTLAYQGEDIGDLGQIFVENNVVRKVEAVMVGSVRQCPSCGHQWRDWEGRHDGPALCRPVP